MKRYGVIMAGGSGTRFWPLSREARPKQFLDLCGTDKMINLTIDRLQGVVEPENIFVVTNEKQADALLQITEGRVSTEHVLREPAARNTAACIGYAAVELLHKYGDGVMCVLASDHYIKDEDAYRKVLEQAISLAETTDRLITIGIKATFPSTGYGYIKSHPAENETYRIVDEFVEKPQAEVAKMYVESGEYVWNSGMFVWKASTILEKFRQLLPDIYEYMMKIQAAMQTPEEEQVIKELYPQIPKISIDYGIMERTEGVLMVEGDFGWNDIGSWDALPGVREADENGNILHGDHVIINSENCICYTNDKLIAAVGVKDLVIVESDGAILVCAKECSQETKFVVQKLTELGKEKYL
ncbi:MAG: mannose-1-phosphate guanylyltransferase [Lachnospiraceae bacterium]|nr:mannose-1-phosphate guanylyltransferase [Lachnospiraceae bacterium]